jgi:hypothetical protein
VRTDLVELADAGQEDAVRKAGEVAEHVTREETSASGHRLCIYDQSVSC